MPQLLSLECYGRAIRSRCLGDRAVEKAFANHPSAVWFGFGETMTDMFCYIAAARSHVNLGW